MWKEFFEGRNASSSGYSAAYHAPLHLFEIDFGPKIEHTLCVDTFLAQYPIPSVVDGIFLGDQVLL